MPKKFTLEEVKNEFINRGYIPLFDNYNNRNDKLLATIDGYMIYTTFRSFMEKITPRIFHPSNPHTLYNIELWLSRNNKAIKLQPDQIYIKNNLNLKFICNKCGVFESSWFSIQHGSNCVYCSGQRVKAGFNDIATLKPELIKYFINKHEATLYTKYSRQIVELRCDICNKEKNKFHN